MVTVVIDPGHGGPRNPPVVGGSSWNNATGPTGLLEKTVTLQVAKAAAAAFAKTGIEVLLTRSTDRNLGIVQRAAVAKNARAEVFVSIHFNAAPTGSPPAQGTETWIGTDPLEQSRDLAGAVQRATVATTGLRDRGVKTGPVSGVINNANHHPATAHCLVEISFLDRQPAEEARLRTADYVNWLGIALRNGIMNYLRSAELIEPASPELAVVDAEEPGDAASAYAAGLITFVPDQGMPQIPVPDRTNTATEAHTPSPPSASGTGEPQVPLIGDPTTNKPFSDIGEKASVDNPSAVLRGFTLEAQIFEWNTVQASLLTALAKAARSVARVVVPAGPYTNYLGDPAVSAWNGTGFLVGENLLLTNHHVLNSAEVAKAAVAEFGYEVTVEDLVAGRTDGQRPVKRFKLDPQRLFVTSPATATGLDFTFVWIEDVATREFGCVKMERASFTANRTDPAFIIHHPRGRPKEVSLDDTDVLRIQSTVLHYAADTDYGSSGAPVFDQNGRLIALHHARKADLREELPDGRIATVLNEGIKISAIAVDLENRVRRNDFDSRMAQTVLHNMTGSDTLTGFFGALGRDIVGESAVEAVVNAYSGTEQDVDIGFWNIEWLATRYRDPEKLDGAATVIMDLNLDIWCLAEVSPPAIQALVEKLHSRFGETFRYEFSEPSASPSAQSTAVIWKPRLVSGQRVAWPAPIDSWWHLDSRDDLPLEAVDGRIFNRYPGLFRFKVEGREQIAPFDFYLVPLHLKAMAEGSKRRRLASVLLTRAIDRMVRNGEDSDWIIGGDVNAELDTGDFQALIDSGMTAMSAADEDAGAFTYLKSPKSLIDNVFISPDMSRLEGSVDYFIVAKDQSMDKFLNRVSDHRPVVLRVSIADGISGVRRADADIVALADRITRAGARSPTVRNRRKRASTKKRASRKRRAPKKKRGATARKRARA